MSSNGWKWYELNQLVKIKYGKNQKKVQDNEKGLYPIYGTGGIMGKSTEFLYDKPSVLIGRKGSISKVKYVEHPFWTVDTLFYTEVDEQIVIPKYLYYTMSLTDFNFYNEGTTIPSLRTETLNRIEFLIPPLEEQKAIAKILSDLDAKIEVNNQISQRLEEMAQALFKHWFVDFEFPNEEGEPYKSSGGEMIESELGMIPKGWEVSLLSDIAKIKYGKNLPTKNLKEEGYPVFGGNGQIGFNNEYLYDEKKILISCRGAASGKVIVSKNKSFITNNSLILDLNNNDIFHYVKEYCLFKQFYQFATGSAQPQITVTNLQKATIIVPEDVIIYKFSKVLTTYEAMVDKSLYEVDILKQTRDTLLPKLMSGELRVTNIQD